MAFCTQRKFPGQSYENSGLAEINKMKAYNSIRDHRAWSTDQNQQTSYLVDAVHKGDEDIVDLQHTMTIGLARCRSDVKKFSKRVGTADVDQHSSAVSQSDSMQIIELSMELEETRLTNSTLKSENADLRKRIAKIMASGHEHERDENMQNHLQILEKIISERNDLRDLLDKFLSVTDQIVELKVQADHMKNVENDYILLQAKCREQEQELQMLRKEKEVFEERIRELETTRAETNALKESNSKLEKDLMELSSVISVSDGFINDQELEIKTKLHTISELNQQIDNLKMALSEAEMKLNKKLRLEMDVELMEKELSMMIENSAESSPYTQQVVDRQVEDLATAIKLTLGCMTNEFENDEEDNLVEANRQLKALLLESSNKILEFKDVINKQEQNLMKVTNDFACKNEELTECLATVEELKRHLANQESKKTITAGSPNAQNVVVPGVDDIPTVGIDEEQEIFEKEMNLADSPQTSEYEDDGPEIEDLENIFEKSCSQQDTGDVYKITSGLRGLKPSEDLKLFNKVKNESMPATKPGLSGAAKSGRETFTKSASHSAEHLRRLSDKIERMSSYINDLESQNNKLKSQVKEASSTGRRNVDIDGSKNDERDTLKDVSTHATHSRFSTVAKVSHAGLKTDADVADASSRVADIVGSNQLNIESKSKLSTDASSGVAEGTKDNQLKIESKLSKDPMNEQDLCQASSAANVTDPTNNERDKLKGKCEPVAYSPIFNVTNIGHDSQKTGSDAADVSGGIADNSSNIELIIGTKEKVSKDPAYNERDICEAPATPRTSEEFANLQHKLKYMISEINLLRMSNQKLMDTIRMLQQSTLLKPSSSDPGNELLKEAHSEESSDNATQDSQKSIRGREGVVTSAEIEKRTNDAEKIDLENERSVAEINDLISSKILSQLAEKDVLDTDLYDLISKNEELRNANEQLLRRISCLEQDVQTANKSSSMHRERLSTKSQQFECDLPSDDVARIENENLNLKLENEKLVVEIGKLKNLGNGSHLNVLEMKKELERLTSINEQLNAELSAKKLEKDLLLAKEVESMPPDMRDLVLRNEELRTENENLLLKIRSLEQAEQSHQSKTTTDLPGQIQDEEISAEPDWLPSNEDLVAEIEKLQQSKNKSNLTIRQMEKELRKLELANENLSVRLNDKESELKHLSMSPDIVNILKQNEELKMLNRNLTIEINELKTSENPDRSTEPNMREELEELANVNKALMTEINELRQKALGIGSNTDQQLISIDDGALIEGMETVSTQTSSQISFSKIEKDLERLAALNECTLALNDTDTDKVHSLLDDTTPDINQLLKKNQELKLANENLSTKVRDLQDTENRVHLEAIETSNRLETLAAANEHLQARITELEQSSSNDRPTNLHSVKNENENLKTTNAQLTQQIAFLEEKLHSIENRTARYLNEQQPSAESMSVHTNDGLDLEIDWMVADMKKLKNRNESLRSTNEKLLSQINELQASVNHPSIKDETKNVAEKMLDKNESDAQLIYACNRNIEIEWMKSDLDALHKKNEKLKSTNNGLAAEIGALKCSETQAHKNMQQMEKDLLRLSAMNERLSTQLNEKRLDKKQLLKVRSQELDSKDLLKKIEELTNSNESLASEITELRGLDVVKMRNDLKRLSSTNDSLKTQIAELSLLSSNELKMESNWMAADMKKLLNKNKKLNMSNQNLLNEINDMRKEFKSLENRANVNALQKVKELDRLTALNENLKDQLNAVNSERRNCKCNDTGANCSITDMRKVHKKNEELKAANEKLLSVIINLKNSEKQATSKVAEMESELHKLRETNQSLQDTLENYVEKDWNIPKTELERICQSILNEGVYSLSNTEYNYMQNWFGQTASADHDIAKTARKNTTRKHCKVCHNSVDAFGKTCECKQYEEKKRLNLLKEIEETKLAIQHIQKSNDIEFDLNDVKNRLLKGKPSDSSSSDDDSPHELRMSQSQDGVNVRAHIITKCVKRSHQPRK
ncbi:putative leucine-rich repeat-containing protein DDB_G0290503 [Bradysia coprophila]|uniref:putative leucine-rich repeat-containing protein DDB_G0290503 n=1 Tax=Bradysia coprophila TaxID=38358 RepID=UPI00187D9633|nr:putative leucine-rich repeat-containing protein DDB_G0290503 [Bradysia coprophila]